MKYYYILENRVPKVIEDFWAWSKWMFSNEIYIKQSDLPKEVKVTTVFLGSFTGDDSRLFETVVSGGVFDGYCVKYATWSEAETGHEEVLSFIFYKLYNQWSPISIY